MSVHVLVKIAQTLDGQIATGTGHSQWITSPESRAVVHQLRAEHDAILTGVGTVIADDPQLNVRLSTGRDPVRVVVDSTLRTPTTARILHPPGGATVIATTESSSSNRHPYLEFPSLQIWEVGSRQGRVDLRVLFQRLEESGHRNVMVEAGSAIVTSLLRDQLVDELVVFIAPKLIGRGLPAIGDLSVEQVSEAVQLSRFSVRHVGSDLMVRARIERHTR